MGPKKWLVIPERDKFMDTTQEADKPVTSSKNASRYCEFEKPGKECQAAEEE